MKRLTTRHLAALAGVAALAGCSGPQAPPSSGGQGAIPVRAGDSECHLDRTSAPAGTISFDVTNTGSQITEFYLYGPGGRIVAEVENIGPGTQRQLVAQVPQGGTYQAACKPGMQGNGVRTPFTVTGQAGEADPAAQAATADYKRFVTQQANDLRSRTREFTDAVKAGDVARAQELYPRAREPWERIEPVAESFEDLDPQIDGRPDDLEPGQPFTGYHRLEQDLWSRGLQPDSAAVADQLAQQVGEVADRAPTTELDAAKVANGAKELLDEVATKKVSGEEDAFSHTDLWDFKANVDGAEQVVDSLRPVLQQKDPKLLSDVDQRFAEVNRELDRFRVGDGFRFYDQVPPEQSKQLAAAVDAVGEPVSRIAGVVAG